MTTKPTIDFLAEILARKWAPDCLRVLVSAKTPLKEEEILEAVNLRLSKEGRTALTREDARKHLQFLGKKGLVKSDSSESYHLSEFGKTVARDLFPV